MWQLLFVLRRAEHADPNNLMWQLLFVLVGLKPSWTWPLASVLMTCRPSNLASGGNSSIALVSSVMPVR